MASWKITEANRGFLLGKSSNYCWIYQATLDYQRVYPMNVYEYLMKLPFIPFIYHQISLVSHDITIKSREIRITSMFSELHPIKSQKKPDPTDPRCFRQAPVAIFQTFQVHPERSSEVQGDAQNKTRNDNTTI
jgi:hypothetical protein